MVRWNFCFKLILFSALLGFGLRAHATQIQALYTAACQRQVGIILGVSPREIKLLNTSGEIVTMKRFEVIYYASFLVDTVPITDVKNPSAVPMLEIKTLESNHLTKLVRGWPVNFSKDKIAVLNEHGTEVLIDRASIWQLDYDEGATAFRFRNAGIGNFTFAHPYAFAGCPLTGSSGKGNSSFMVYPQQLLNDPISIKRELDRFAEGYEQLHQYDIDQDFYARPEIYQNETQLGLWLSTGSRYGSSHDRPSNFTPYLVNDFSSGPFGFQSEFKTGAGPIYQSIHEEPQTQIYYRLKADYFHFTGMVDPNLVLAGERYKWSRDDLGGDDIRANDEALLEFGFDYGRFSLELYPGGILNFAAQTGGRFRQTAGNIIRAGIRWQGFHWMFNLIGGAGSRDEQGPFKASIIRANLEWQPSNAQRYEFSLLERQLTVQSTDDTAQPAAPFQVQGTSFTAAAYGHFRFKKRYWAGGMLAVESLKTSYGYTSYDNTSSKIYPKIGALISLAF